MVGDSHLNVLYILIAVDILRFKQSAVSFYAEANRFHSYTQGFNMHHVVLVGLFCFYTSHNAPRRWNYEPVYSQAPLLLLPTITRS